MSRKTITLTLITALFTLWGLTSMAQKEAYGTVEGPHPYGGPAETGPILYDQIWNAGGGWLNSTEYTDAANLTKTSETADDFDVPAGETWDIGKVAFTGYYGYGNLGGASAANIRIYANDGGQPGTELHSFLNVTPSVADEMLNGSYVASYWEVPISPTLSLTEGKYWLSVQVVSDYTVSGDWGWGDAENDPRIGEMLYWRNPLDGWGNGYTTWTPGDIVMFFGYLDRAFALYESSKTDDLAARTVTSPTSDPALTATETVTMELKNEGTAVQTGFEVAYIINGGTPVVENVGGFSLNPEEVNTYSFGTTADFSTPGVYDVQIITMLGGDEYMNNDTAFAQIYNYGTIYIMSDDESITTCDGTFTDPGGLYNDFGPDDKATVTIFPGTPGNKIRLNFVAFDVTWSDFYIYDGLNTDAPLLGYWQDDDNPGVITALNPLGSGALTIDFEAPGWDQAFGWEAIISCYDQPDNDFEITDLQASTQLIYTGLELHYTATLRNLGATAQSKVVSFYANDVLIGTANTGSVGPAEFATATLAHTFDTPGMYTIEARIPDDEGDVPANNSLKKDYTVYLIDTFVEFFEQETFPPDYWSVEFTAPAISSWILQTSSGFPYDNSFGCAQAYVPTFGFDTLVSPQLYISDGDRISIMLKTSLWWPGKLQIIWKDAATGVWSPIDVFVPSINYEYYETDISAAEGLNYIGFVAMCDDPWSWGGELTMDNVVGLSPTLYFVDDDVKASNLQGTATPAVNDPTTYTVDVKNIGNNTVMYNTYSIKLMQKDPAGDIELTSAIGLTSTHLQERVYDLTYSFQASGEYDIYAVVDYDADMDVNNDTTNSLHLWVQVSGTEEIEVGTEDEWDIWMPTRTGSNFSISQTIYEESYLNTTGAITGVKYFFNNDGYSVVEEIPIKLYIGTTTESVLGGYLDPANMTLVFDDTVDFDLGMHEFYVPFSVPINYTGDNIVAYMYQAHEGWKPTVNFAMHNVEDTVGGWSTSYYYINPMLPDSGTTCNKEYMIPVTNFFVNTAGFGEVGGTVYDEDNNPLPDAEVKIDGTFVSDMTDENGEYLINEILGGSQSLTASKFEYEDNTQPINITAGIVNVLDFHLELKPRVDVSGTVVGNDDPLHYLEGALIEMWGYSNYQSAADENGEFIIPWVYGNETYSVKISKHGYVPYFNNSVVVTDGNLDLGTIALEELMSIPFSVYAAEADADINLSWNAPNTSLIHVYNYDLLGTNGYAAEPYEEVWLGNIYETEDRGTITTVEVYWWEYYTQVGEVTLEILDAEGNVVMTSEPFETDGNTWQLIDIPDVYFEGTFFAMIHWKDVPVVTHYLGSQDSEFGAHGPNYGYIMYPGEDPYLVSELLDKDVSFEIIVHTEIEAPVDNDPKYVEGYNIYRGLLEDVHNSSSWAPLNGSVVTDTTYVDGTWPPATAGDYIYAVEAVYTTGESVFSHSNTMNYTPVGVDELGSKEVSVYPNPARDVLYIQNVDLGSAKIYSATGQLMGDYRISDQLNTINVSGFGKGLYIIKIVGDNNEVTSMKFFKN